MKLAIAVAAAGVALASPAFAGQTIQVGSFNAVEASDGAGVIVRHGDRQQVTMVEGSLDVSNFEVRDGALHIITCRSWHCPNHYRLRVEVVMPQVSAIEATDGADIDVEGPFPPQRELAVKASDGGNIDARAIAAANVNARASDGGNLRIQPRKTMQAHAVDGGNIRYWGNPSVTSLVASDGGNVSSED
ncbi:MAG: GIN domain-containing protein [Rhizomicrobium sp.]